MPRHSPHRRPATRTAHPERRRSRNIPAEDLTAFEFPAELADAETVGLVYDDIDGLNFYNDYGMLRELFADPALAADKRYADVLRKPGFTWTEHGEALLRRRKPWYYEQEPRPGVSVIGARLSELVALR